MMQGRGKKEEKATLVTTSGVDAAHQEEKQRKIRNLKYSQIVIFFEMKKAAAFNISWLFFFYSPSMKYRQKGVGPRKTLQPLTWRCPLS